MKPRVALFVTCLVDLVRPQIGFAAIHLIEASGCMVEVPAQTCCGQPAYNAGARTDAKEIAKQTVAAFEGYDYIVAPSGSCAAMLRLHYPGLFAGDGEWEEKSRNFAARVHELTSFLVDVRGMTSTGARHEGRVAYHDSCSGLRELGLGAAARRLLGAVDGLELIEIPERETCCGFGGLFSVKYPEISNAIVEKKCSNVATTKAGTLVGGDLGCLMNIAGKLSRQGSPIACRHIAELLAGDVTPPL